MITYMMGKTLGVVKPMKTHTILYSKINYQRFFLFVRVQAKEIEFSVPVIYYRIPNIAFCVCGL